MSIIVAHYHIFLALYGTMDSSAPVCSVMVSLLRCLPLTYTQCPTNSARSSFDPCGSNPDSTAGIREFPGMTLQNHLSQSDQRYSTTDSARNKSGYRPRK